jgi:hypothetical protein
LLDENLGLSRLVFFDDSWNGECMNRHTCLHKFYLTVGKGVFDSWTIPLFDQFHDECSLICQCSVDLLNEFWLVLRKE